VWTKRGGVAGLTSSLLWRGRGWRGRRRSHGGCWRDVDVPRKRGGKQAIPEKYQDKHRQEAHENEQPTLILEAPVLCKLFLPWSFWTR
jgi:hypothetical protein